MSVTYDNLWKLLIDKKINKNELHKITGLSTSTINKLKNNENVNVSVIEKICLSLNCSIEDIMSITNEEEDK
ncbi:MAG: helix-turn-helix transcriptional regulator [Erysipelotrichaceae bacterium]|nr:helix-turn-helix transcriptional regulator [Erysipelotrichaceae bacterium]